MGNLLSDGTEFECPFCSTKLKLCVPSSSSQGSSLPLANTSNSFFPPPGGTCTLTQSPCTPVPILLDNGQSPVYIEGQPALGDQCKFACCKGGIIQNPVSAQTTSRHEKTDKSSDKPIQKCKDIRAEILAEAHNIIKKVADSGNIIYYTQDMAHRHGETAEGKSTRINYHHEKASAPPFYIKGPVASFDCSGFVSKVFLNKGKSLKNYGASTDYPDVKTINGLTVFQEIPLAKAQPGDLVIWLSRGGGRQAHHVGIYEGNKKFLSALVNPVINLTEKKFKTSVYSIGIEHFNGHLPRVLRFTDCEEEQ